MMTKYWKTIGLLMIIILGIGTFYIYKQVAGNPFPEFVIEKQNGDRNEIAPVTVEGQFRNERTFDDVRITGTSTSYGRDLSYLDVYRHSSFSTDMVHNLQQKYWNFMRGKNNSFGFYEDEALLVYADTNPDYSSFKEDFQFEISILNKNDNKSHTFKADVPNDEHIVFSDVVEVQRVNDQLYVFTNNELNSENEETTEMRVYEFNIDTKKMVDHKAIVEKVNEGDVNTDSYLLSEVDSKGKHDYAVFRSRKTKETVDDDGEEAEEVLAEELIVYSIDNGETKMLDVPDEVRHFDNVEMIFDETTLYFISKSKKELTVQSYDLKSDEIIEQYTIEIPEPDTSHANTKNIDVAADDNYPNVEIKNDTLYMVTGSSGDVMVLVANIDTGEVLYNGVVQLKSDEAGVDNFKLDVHRLTVDEL